MKKNVSMREKVVTKLSLNGYSNIISLENNYMRMLTLHCKTLMLGTHTLLFIQSMLCKTFVVKITIKISESYDFEISLILFDPNYIGNRIEKHVKSL